jgi:CubicO group peptidase (beta-lactamase class C family)
MSKQLSSRVMSSVLAVAVVAGCGEVDVAVEQEGAVEKEEAITEQRSAVSASAAASLAFPEYDLNVPAEDFWFASATTTDIDNKRAAGFRLHDLDVVSVSPLRFSAVLIRNIGPYTRSGQGWASAMTETQILALYADKNRRITDIAQYQVSGQWRYAVVWVANVNEQFRDYKLVLNVDQAAFEAAAAGYRVVSVEKGPLLTCPGICIPIQKFSGVMIKSVGTDARTQYFNRLNMNGLLTLTRDNAAACGGGQWGPPPAPDPTRCRRLALVEEMGNDQFYVVTERVLATTSANGAPILAEGEQSWWAANQFAEAGNRNNPDSIEHVARRLGARFHRVRPYSTSAGTRFIVTYTRNDDPVPSAGSSDDGNEVLKEIDAIAARQMRRTGIPGLNLGIVQGGRLVHAKGYGYSDVQALRITQPTDVFRIASISKALAKGAMVKLGREGRTVTPPGGGAPVTITLDAKPWRTIASWDPGNAPPSPNLGDITVRDLIQHQSGVRFISDEFCNCKNMSPVPNGCDQVNDVSPCRPFENAVTPEDWRAAEQAVKDAKQKLFYVHRPGEYHPRACPVSMLGTATCPTTGSTPSTAVWQYMNTNYSIVGAVISRTTKMPYDSYLRANFLDPLQLNRVRVGKFIGTPPTGCAAPTWPFNLFHAVHYQLPEPYRKGDPWDDNGSWVTCNADAFPAGAYSASPVDFLRWATSIDGSTPGYQPLDAIGKNDMFSTSLCDGWCGTSHTGYLPFTTSSNSFDIPAGGATVPETVRVMALYNSDVIDRNDLEYELRVLLNAKSDKLPKRDLFPSYFPTSFLPLTLVNGWINAPFVTNNAGVAVVAGKVYLRGAINTTGTNAVPFTLPDGFRPNADVYVPINLCDASKGRLYIQPNGTTTVQVEGGTWANAQCFTSLDGASFATSASGTTALALQNGWINAPFGTRNAAVININGVIHLQGAIGSGTTNAPFTIPSGFRPSTDVYVPVDLCNATKGRLLIQPSGAVFINTFGAFGDAQCFLSLEGASYALTSSGTTALTLQNGWVNAPFGTRNAAVRISSGIVGFQGAISTGSNAPAFTLPGAFRPAKDVYVPVDLCNAQKGRILIQPSGSVSVQTIAGGFSAAQCFTSLEGASFGL